PPPSPTLFPYTTLFRSAGSSVGPWTAATYAAAATGLLILVFCELLPRSVAVPHAASVAPVVIRPVYLLSIVVYPVGFAFTWLTRSEEHTSELQSRENLV